MREIWGKTKERINEEWDEVGLWSLREIEINISGYEDFGNDKSIYLSWMKYNKFIHEN